MDFHIYLKACSAHFKILLTFDYNQVSKYVIEKGYDGSDNAKIKGDDDNLSNCIC